MFSRLARKIALLFSRDRFRSELEEEMAFHREQAEQALIAEGVAPQDARYATLRQFGNTTQLREQSQEIMSLRPETIVQDGRFALRQLRKSPAFAATVIFILALGIAASVAIFSFFDAVLIKPLPYRNPGRLAILFESTSLGRRFHLSYLDYLDWKKQNKVFSSLEVYEPDGFMLKARAGTEPVDGVAVSAGFFRTLGVVPVLGRDFYPDEDSPGATQTVILSYGSWQKRYAGRPDVLGRAVVLNGQPHIIIGVLPRDFSFAPAEPVEFWGSLHGTGPCEKERGCHDLYGVARLKDAVSFSAAAADIKAIAEQLETKYPVSNHGQAAYMLPLSEVIVGNIRPVLLLLLSGAGLLLLIAGLNVAGLLLVRSETRRREMALRGALGASRLRLLRQLVTEGLILAALGCTLGVAWAYAAVRLLVRLVPKDMAASMPFLNGLGLNMRVAGFACAASLGLALLLAFVPALRIPFDVREGLSDGGRSASGSMWRRFGANLVVAELATAMVLLVAAGLLGKSFYRLLHANIGLAPDHLAMLRVAALAPRYPKDAQLVVLEQEILRRVAALPGVKSEGISSRLPIGDGDGTKTFRILGHPDPGWSHPEVAYRAVSPRYLATLGGRLVRGRYFTEDDGVAMPHMAVINQTMARTYFQGEDPIGLQISFGDSGGPATRIIGIVDDIQEGQLDAPPRPAAYIPITQDAPRYFAVLVRTAQQERSLLPLLATTIHQIDPSIPTFGATSMDERIHDAPSTSLHRSLAWLVGTFAVLALLLGVVGLYGVIAYSVSQRTREIGVRMALGAQRTSVYKLIMQQAGRLTAAGIIVGLVCSTGASLLMRKLLFGVDAWDAATVVSVAVWLALASLAASFMPARRAASVNPMDALRAE
ncbi:MAG: ADOP family duplicated permease [Actinomycetota bacterium]